MVDRIVPRTTDADRAAIAVALGVQDARPVWAEAFFAWAVEGQFAADRPDRTRGGARFVASAEPWQRLELRMVNGAHSSIANPALAHRTPQIAMDGSQKLPQRLLGTVRDRLAAGAPVFGDPAGHATLADALPLPMLRLQQQGVRGALAAIREPSDD